jgi:hypothetical protein
MPLTRVYLALTPADLEALAGAGALGTTPVRAHAVTPALGSPGLTTDEEELEHLAWVAAADEAGAGARDGSRRVVAAADVEAESVSYPTAADVPSRVEVADPVTRRQVVSFHVDEEPGATGTADLLWYDVTELDAVRALTAG